MIDPEKKQMSYTIIIPARMHSTRLPMKPLKDICGKPMIVRVVEQALKTKADRVVVATDHEDILKAVQDAGYEAVMTSSECSTGTDRLAQAAEFLGIADDEVVVNIQGDEPLMPPEVADAVAEMLAAHPEASMSTAAHTLGSVEEFLNPNVVKVVLDASGLALYFSRAPIPWPRDHFASDKGSLPEDFEALHHLGIYAYRRSYLRQYPSLVKSPLEKAESLEQLRAMHNGHRIAVKVLHEALPAGVDTQDDLDRVRRIFSSAGL